jgi:hypothetical protein
MSRLQKREAARLGKLSRRLASCNPAAGSKHFDLFFHTVRHRGMFIAGNVPGWIAVFRALIGQFSLKECNESSARAAASGLLFPNP